MRVYRDLNADQLLRRWPSAALSLDDRIWDLLSKDGAWRALLTACRCSFYDYTEYLYDFGAATQNMFMTFLQLHRIFV